jgi:hypothetical protein
VIEFGLWADCADAGGHQAFVRHFTGLTHTLLNGRAICWKIEAERGRAPSLGVEVWCPDISRSGIRTVADALEVSEAGLRLMHHLLSAPEFPYARLDWQAPNIPLSDVHEYVCTCADGTRQLWETCVMQTAVFDRLGSPEGYKPFRPGYVWRPYHGERYYPVGSNDYPTMFELERALFPA